MPGEAQRCFTLLGLSNAAAMRATSGESIFHFRDKRTLIEDLKAL